MQLITHSRQDAFKVCRKKHWYAYELGIRREDDAKALRMGSAFHDAIEQLANGHDLTTACERVYLAYANMPEVFDDYEWLIERETVLRLVCGYQWRWDDSIHYVAAEQSFRLPLINPASGVASKRFEIGGKIDGIVVLEDGRSAVIEHKLLSEELGDESPLWRRLRIDHQISMYVHAARRLGYQVATVMYDVCRKPTIKPSSVPILDSLGAKIVLDRDGNRVKTERGLWRQTGSSEHGYVLQTRPMNAEEWGEKLSNDIADRPEFYFARREIARCDVDIFEFESELLDIQKTMREAQREDRHYRTCNKETCAWCPYFDICSTGWQPTDALPFGFVRVENLHPELGETDVNSNAIAASGDTEEAASPAVATTN